MSSVRGHEKLPRKMREFYDWIDKKNNRGYAIHTLVFQESVCVVLCDVE